MGKLGATMENPSARHAGARTRTARGRGAVAGLLSALAACGGASSDAPVSQASELLQLPARTVEYAERGDGPTIVLESGLGDGYRAFRPVWDGLAELGRLFAYSRAGYGRSSSVEGERDGAAVVAELHEALVALALPGPYVLVGHSLGAEYVLLFARTYPDEVRGVVLVPKQASGEVEARRTTQASFSGELG